MNLKLRFALLFSLLVFIILMISLSTVYILYENFREDQFIERVKTQAIRTFHLDYKRGEVNPNLKKAIDDQSKTMLFDDQVLIYNSASHVVYSKPLNISPPPGIDLFNKISKREPVTFDDGEREGLAFSVQDNGIKYIVVASALDKIGRNKIARLRSILVVTLIVGLLLSALFAFFFVRQIIKPIVHFSSQIRDISDNNLDARIAIPQNTGELSRIAKNVNDMLDRLQKNFETRRNFVQRASHELRTPLAAMLSQTEVALKKDLSVAEHKEVLGSLRQYQVEMGELTNSLLLLSQFQSSEYSEGLVPVRVDEILFETVDIFKEYYPNANIAIDFISVPDNSNFLTIRGSESLLKAAFRHLIKNAYIYSTDANVDIKIGADEKRIEIYFENKGKQLSQEETARLFSPFFRGENAAFVKGTGLGLAIVQRSIMMHKGTVEYQAVGEDTNRVTVQFKA